jgi:hypothetical protein
LRLLVLVPIQPALAFTETLLCPVFDAACSSSIDHHVGFGKIARFGVWRSPVARLLWEQDVESSNPSTPTIRYQGFPSKDRNPFFLSALDTAGFLPAGGLDTPGIPLRGGRAESRQARPGKRVESPACERNMAAARSTGSARGSCCLVLLPKHRLEIGEGGVGCGWSAVRVVGGASGGFQLSLMLVVVAIQAKQFPVAAIGRVVVVVVVAVMHGQFAHIGAREFPGATAANPGIDLQGLLAIALLAELQRNVAPRRRCDRACPGSDAFIPAIFPAACCSCAGPGSWIPPC